MQLREILQNLFNHLGVEWILILLIVLSVLSIAVIIERFWFFRKIDIELERGKEAVRKGSVDLLPAGCMERDVLEEIMSARNLNDDSWELIASSRIGEAKLRYQKRVSFLGTIGSNAPYIGLLGTVIGIMGAFYDLKDLANTAQKTELVMISISEALVATAVGLLVAIPAVIGYNYFMQKIKKAEERTMSLADLAVFMRKNEEKKSS